VVEVDVEALAVRAQSGDSHALNDLLAASQPLVTAKARRFLPNPLDAEEATQDALLSIARNIDSFGGRSKYTTWLHQVTTNACIDRYRKLKRRQSVLVTPQEQPASGSTPSVVTGARVAILDAAEQLDRKVVEPVLMRDLLDMDYADIAELLDVNESTLRWQVAEGRKQLRRLLSPLT
jgi:RNA polymerase sigma-70 factor (ECF subfamily)